MLSFAKRNNSKCLRVCDSCTWKQTSTHTHEQTNKQTNQETVRLIRVEQLGMLVGKDRLLSFFYYSQINGKIFKVKGPKNRKSIRTNIYILF